MNIFMTIPGFTPHGGIRVIIEWANRLSSSHNVVLYCKEYKKPTWGITILEKIKIVNDIDDLKTSDCLIVTSPHDSDLLTISDAPYKKFIFLQMLEHLFRPSNLDWQEKCKKLYLSPYPIICISKWNIDYLKKIGRIAPTLYVGNGVNIDDFPIVKTKKDKKIVLVEGWNPSNPTKDTEQIAPRVANKLKQEGYTILAYGAKPISGKYSKVPEEYFVSPGLTVLNDLYERATILIKATKCDARSCSPMEAMTKGTPTARAIDFGDDDLVDGINCLKSAYVAEALYQNAKRLLTIPTLRKEIIKKCFLHLKENSWDYWMKAISTILETPQANDRLCIISVVYDEPEWQETKEALEATGYPIHYVTRAGVASLAHALNVAFAFFVKPHHEYVWFVTNVTFDPMLPQKLVKQMDKSKFSALHPEFDSDHSFCCRNGSKKNEETPFIEFTSPIVRTEVFKEFYLDEKMPYWGHDLDWGYRVKRDGHKIGVCHSERVEHVYIRNSKSQHPSTIKRSQLRAASDKSTKDALKNKYGVNWKKIVWPT